jgi:hypothetical protein
MSKACHLLGALRSPLIQWLASLLLSAVIVMTAAMAVLGVVGDAYVRKTPVAAFEEDLGYGLLMVLSSIVAMIVALPVWGALTCWIRRVIARRV